MGSSQSTRKVTVNNESSHIIKVSDSVIERLKNNNSNTSSNPTSVVKNVAQVTKVQEMPTVVANPAISYGGSLTSVQVLQEKERQLKENDAYWANRVQSLEEAQGSARRLMEQEFTHVVTSLEARLPKVPKKISEAPCGDKKAKVLECYRNNPKQILLCAKEVAEFADCVDRKRLATA